MRKKSLFGLCLGVLLALQAPSTAAVQFSPGLDGAGFRVSLVVPDYYDVGFGVGLHADVGLIQMLHFYPSFEYLHAADAHRYNYLDNTGIYYRYVFLNEFSLNGDLRFYPPLPPLIINPFLGCGLAFIVSNEYNEYEPVVSNYNLRPTSDNDVGLGFNLLLGCDIPIGNILLNLEMKVKVGTEYTIFKLSAGLTFPISRSYRGR